MDISSAQKMYRHWKYKNTAFLIVSMLLFFYFLDSPTIDAAVQHLKRFGYVGAYIAGIMFVSTYTVAPGIVLLYHFGTTLNPLGVAFSAGLGGVLGDYLLFHFFRDKIFEELRPLLKQMSGPWPRRIFHTPYFAWLAPVCGAFIIMSPFPDEGGIALLGVSKLKSWQFLLLTLFLDIIGVLLVVLAARTL